MTRAVSGFSGATSQRARPRRSAGLPELKAGRVRSLAFVADPAHSSYAGALSIEEIARRIAICCGMRGPNIDYLENTLKHLEELGVRDHHLTQVYRALAPHRLR